MNKLTPLRRTAVPLECSEGVRPQHAIALRGLLKRMKSPTSATTVTGVRKATPLIAWNASIGRADESCKGSEKAARWRRPDVVRVSSLGLTA